MIPLATPGFRLLQDTATLNSYFWITLQQHAAYNGSISRHHTFHHLAATSKQTVDLSKKIKKITIREKQCVHSYTGLFTAKEYKE
jgi:hypothetical protein